VEDDEQQRVRRTISDRIHDLVERIKERDLDKINEINRSLEKEFKYLEFNDHHRWSREREMVVTIPEKIREMEDGYETLMFELSDRSNESILDVKKFSVYDVHMFMRNIIRKYRKTNDKGESSD